MDRPQHHIKSLDLFSATIPGFFVVTKRSIPFFCGEAVLGNYEGSCFKNWYSHELAKTSLFPLGSSSFQFLAALSPGIFQISLRSYEPRLISCPKQIL